jgi:hypothetical protein
MSMTRITNKDKVLDEIQLVQEEGLTVPEFLRLYPSLLPQTVYPCFTQLCKEKKILHSGSYRKSKNNRRSIVWVDKKHGGVVPVWGSGQPSYSYKNRAKVVMDLLADFGPLSVSEMMTSCSSLKPMSTSSLVSRLVRQQWLFKTNKTRRNALDQTCCLYDLTPRGRQVRNDSPRRDSGTFASPPDIRRTTEKPHG